MSARRWISFKGIRSDELNMIVQKMPDYTFATRHYSERIIPGRGSLFIDDGYYDTIKLTVTLNCFGADNVRIFAIQEWLSGRGELIFSDNPERCYNALITTQPLVTSFRTADGAIYDSIKVTFTCEPFAADAEPSVYRLTAHGFISGEGVADSEPVIKVTGSGDVTLTVGVSTMSIAGLSGSMTIDCVRKLAYSGTTSLSHAVSVTGGWPKMSKDSTEVSWTGSVTSVIITPNWRWT